MTQENEELDRLIEAVEGGDPNVWTFYEALPREIYDRGVQAYHGSLDAAKALHDGILDSGYHAEIEACCTRPRVRVVRLDVVFYGGEQVTEARSWLLAILKAYRAQQEG